MPWAEPTSSILYLPENARMSERRRVVFSQNRELIEHCYAESREDKASTVILVLDLTDDLSLTMAKGIVGDDAVQERIVACNRQGNDPILIADFGYEVAISTFANASESGVRSIESIARKGLVPVAVFGDGGVSWAGIPRPSH